MKIRLQIILTLMPVFIFLGAVLATLNYVTRRDEIEFACQEEVYGTAVALAEFLSSDRVRQELAAGDRSRFSFVTSVKRVLVANPIGSVSIKDVTDGAPLWTLGEPRVTAVRQKFDGRPLRARENVLFSMPEQQGTDEDGRIVALVPLVTPAGPFALMELELDGSWVLQSRRAVLYGSAALFGVTLLLGLLATGLTGRMIAGSVKDLREATRFVAEGRYSRRVEPGLLGEFNDLGNTFNTMTSLLEETLLRMKRAVIEAEQFRKPTDLAARFGESLWKPGMARLGKFRLLAMRFGGQPNGDFLGLWNVEGMVRIAMGRVLESGEMDSAVTASAALRLIEEEIRNGGAGFGKAGEVFHFKFWNLIVWDEEDSELEVLSYRFGHGVETRQRVPINGGPPLNWHSLQGDGARRLKLILEAFPSFREEDLTSGLSGILGGPTEGGVVVLLSE